MISLKRLNRFYLIFVTGALGFIGLFGAPGILAGAGGPEATTIVQFFGVLALIVMARLIWIVVQEDLVSTDSDTQQDTEKRG